MREAGRRKTEGVYFSCLALVVPSVHQVLNPRTNCSRQATKCACQPQVGFKPVRDPVLAWFGKNIDKLSPEVSRPPKNDGETFKLAIVGLVVITRRRTSRGQKCIRWPTFFYIRGSDSLDDQPPGTTRGVGLEMLMRIGVDSPWTSIGFT